MINGKRVTREALVQNEKLLELAMEHLGSRVGVDVLSLHVRSLYDFMGVLAPSS